MECPVVNGDTLDDESLQRLRKNAKSIDGVYTVKDAPPGGCAKISTKTPYARHFMKLGNGKLWAASKEVLDMLFKSILLDEKEWRVLSFRAETPNYQFSKVTALFNDGKIYQVVYGFGGQPARRRLEVLGNAWTKKQLVEYAHNKSKFMDVVETPAELCKKAAENFVEQNGKQLDDEQKTKKIKELTMEYFPRFHKISAADKERLYQVVQLCALKKCVTTECVEVFESLKKRKESTSGFEYSADYAITDAACSNRDADDEPITFRDEGSGEHNLDSELVETSEEEEENAISSSMLSDDNGGLDDAGNAEPSDDAELCDDADDSNDSNDEPPRTEKLKQTIEEAQESARKKRSEKKLLKKQLEELRGKVAETQEGIDKDEKTLTDAKTELEKLEKAKKAERSKRNRETFQELLDEEVASRRSKRARKMSLSHGLYAIAMHPHPDHPYHQIIPDGVEVKVGVTGDKKERFKQHARNQHSRILKALLWIECVDRKHAKRAEDEYHKVNAETQKLKLGEDKGNEHAKEVYYAKNGEDIATLLDAMTKCVKTTRRVAA